jgi:hypothetical protein
VIGEGEIQGGGLEREGLESEGLKGFFSVFANHIRNI